MTSLAGPCTGAMNGSATAVRWEALGTAATVSTPTIEAPQPLLEVGFFVRRRARDEISNPISDPSFAANFCHGAGGAIGSVQLCRR